jgi:hypothetical protein
MNLAFVLCLGAHPKLWPTPLLQNRLRVLHGSRQALAIRLRE